MFISDTELDSKFIKSPEVLEARKLAGQRGYLDFATERFTGAPEAAKPASILDRIKNLFAAPPKSKISSEALEDGYGKLSSMKERLADAKKYGGDVGAVEKEIEALKDSLRGHAEELIPQMSAAKEAHMQAKAVLNQSRLDAHNAARDAFTTATTGVRESTPAYKAALDKLADTRKNIDAKFNVQIEKHTKVLDGIQQWEAKIGEHLGVKAEDVMAKLKTAAPVAAEAVKDVGKTVVGKTVAAVTNKEGNAISKGAQELGILGEKGLEAKGGYFARKLADVSANFKTSGALTLDKAGEVVATKSSALNKGLKVLSTGAGVFLIGSGLKDLGKFTGMVSPDVDEQGKEVPADTGTLIKSAVEVGAGAALAYFSLLKGGKAAGMVK